MQVVITPKKLNGTLNIMPSKSYTHRAIILASLANGKSIINNVILSDDIKATISLCESFGASIYYQNNKLEITGSSVNKVSSNLFANESGSSLRFMIPVLLLGNDNISINVKEGLMKRPFEPYYEVFDLMGINHYVDSNSLCFDGKLKPGVYEIDGSVSSQFITGLLISMPLLNGDSKLIIKNELVSKSYIDITLELLKEFGAEIINNNYQEFVIRGNQNYQPLNYNIEGDYSQAAFFLVANCLGSNIKINGLNSNSIQADKKIIDYIEYLNNDLDEAIIDINKTIDLAPILAVLLGTKKYKSKIVNGYRLKLKESDRISSIVSELKKMNINVRKVNDEIHFDISNDIKLLSELDSHNDHRIVMALAILSTISKNEVVINNAEAVNKSYPDFFKDFERLGGVIHEKY